MRAFRKTIALKRSKTRSEAELKKQGLRTKLSGLERLKNNKFDESISMIKLANRGFEFYKLANPDEKREMLKIVFSNLSFDGKKLDFTLEKPFDMFYQCNESQIWLRGLDSNQRPNG